MTKTTNRWPAQVPYLSKDNICKGVFENGDNKRCLAGWCNEVFGGGSPYQPRCESPIWKKVHNALIDVTGTEYYSQFNDNMPKEAVAKAWNRTMAKLGYTEVE